MLFHDDVLSAVEGIWRQIWWKRVKHGELERTGEEALENLFQSNISELEWRNSGKYGIFFRISLSMAEIRMDISQIQVRLIISEAS